MSARTLIEMRLIAWSATLIDFVYKLREGH